MGWSMPRTVRSFLAIAGLICIALVLTGQQANNPGGAAGSKIVYSTQSSTSSASITSTTMVASTPAAQNYKITPYAMQVAAGTSCTGNTTLKLFVIYTDPVSGAQNVPVQTFGVATNGTVNTAVPALSNGMASYIFPVTSGSSISYTVTYSLGTSCSPGPTYYVIPYLEANP